ncbi:MAG: hypothetical protein QM751_07370 [Paludibacteraceae bacterium]
MNFFSSDLKFLKSHDSDLVVLSSDDEKSQVVVSAKYQGKVFTSTTNGADGESIGFVNRKAFDKANDEHIHVYGGENRFWLGPEGGNYSVFFKKGVEQNFDNWFTPKAIDTEAWQLTDVCRSFVSLKKEARLQNAQDIILQIDLNRRVELLSDKKIEQKLGIKIGKNIRAVAYSTSNNIINKNNFEWTSDTGTVCLWMLDMFPPAADALTIVPYIDDERAETRHIAKTDYFGEIPTDRLQFHHGNLYLKTDGKYRSKIGLNKHYAKSWAGNYNPEQQLLTVIWFDINPEADYLNQQWGACDDVFNGDVLNAYNDGPLDDGSILGPFFELESSSPAAFLKPGESIEHQHAVFHFQGDKEELSEISRCLFNVDVSQIKIH